MFNGYVRLPDGIHCNPWRKFWLKAVPQNYPWELQYHLVIELALLEEFQENGMDPMADLDISPKKRPWWEPLRPTARSSSTQRR